jgi:hypothetical protein
VELESALIAFPRQLNFPDGGKHKIIVIDTFLLTPASRHVCDERDFHEFRPDKSRIPSRPHSHLCA